MDRVVDEYIDWIGIAIKAVATGMVIALSRVCGRRPSAGKLPPPTRC